MRLVNFKGKAYDTGRKYGRITSIVIKQRLAEVISQMKINDIPKDEFYYRAKIFRKILKDISPYWLEEIQGISSELKIDPDDLLILNSLPEDFYNKNYGNNCTSFVAVGNASMTGESIIHKNRDEHNFVQNVYIKELENTYKYLGGGDIGNLGISYFVNQKGLAGANNTGSPIIESEVNYLGLKDCHIMRIIAEKASSCEDAIKIIDNIIERGFCGSCGDRGMIFLLVDKDKGVVIENTSYHFSYKFIKDETLVRSNHFMLSKMKKYIKDLPDKNTITRYKRVKKLIDLNKGKISAEYFNDISRDHKNGPDDSICNENYNHFWMTLSGFTCIIRNTNTDILSLSYISNGHPHNTIYFPLHLGANSVPNYIISGRDYKLSDNLYKKYGSGNHLNKKQKKIESNNKATLTKVEDEAKYLLKKGMKKKVIKLLCDNDYKIVKKIKKLKRKEYF